MEVAAAEKATTEMMRFEETELRLGLPGGGGGGGGEVVVSARKRGFSETVDLQLNLSTLNKDPAAEAITLPASAENKSLLQAQTSSADPAKPPAKAQVVGWPPVRSFRKNMVAVKKTGATSTTNSNITTVKDKDGSASAESEVTAASFVKVSMDGAPYLRKVDLKMYGSYKQLSDALSTMFVTNNNDGGLKDFMNDGSNNNNNNNNSTDDYVSTYEDKDGDWMLVGDVPWEMFVVSCKRLRIMKGKDAIIGLAPRGMEKRKNRA